MKFSLARFVIHVILAVGIFAPASVRGSEPPSATSEQAEQFENEIRPLLAAHCFECHGEKKQEAGLRLDRRAGFFKGTDDGPIFSHDDPAKSKVFKSIRREGDSPMPPDAKLPAEATAKLTAWLTAGAPWPDHGDAPAAPSIADQARAHWAFQPVKDPPVPTLSDPWARTPIDAFIFARLKSKNLKPSPAADPRTLIRRASYDLTGLPPTPAEVAEFIKDPSDEAYETLIDRLLASPAYGERYARYWLDLARYADTKGYVFNEDRKYHYAYVYRDWVVDALNADMPYDLFLIKQLAADRLTADQDKPDPDRAASGFLTLGRRFLNNKADIIDDRIDVVIRTTQALTVACARCHDHKFDPIPTADYYSLYGVFAATQDRQIPIAQPSADYLAEIATREAKIEARRNRERDALQSSVRERVGDYLLRAQILDGDTTHPELLKQLEKLDLSRTAVDRWKRELERAAKDRDPVFLAWVEFAKLPEREFAAQSVELAKKIAADELGRPLHPNVRKLFEGEAPPSLQAVAARYGGMFAEVDREWQAALKHAAESQQPEPKQLPDEDREILRLFLYGEKSPATIPPDQIDRALGKNIRDQIKKLEDDLGKYKASSAAPLQALTLADEAKIDADQPIFLRGNSGRHGPRVPRRFLAVVSGPGRKPFNQGSGRLELAHAIASPDNPLTARVIVNRAWMWHFGSGLVPNVSDFGLRTAAPSHPELLDYLASRFIAEGWSLKKLHRTILLSNTYRQSSHDRPDARNVDPENLLLWRANRRRLDLEGMRDSLLAASGTLDRTLGGPSIEMVQPATSRRRSIYGIVERQNLPGFFRTFDFASPDHHTGQRFTTTVPQQALFLMNSPFVVDMSTALRDRPEVRDAENIDARIDALFQWTLQRAPNETEALAAREFLKDVPVKSDDEEHRRRWLRFAQAMLMTNEFLFVD